MSRQTDFHVIHYCMGEVITDNNDVREVEGVGRIFLTPSPTELNSKLACTSILSERSGSDYHCHWSTWLVTGWSCLDGDIWWNFSQPNEIENNDQQLSKYNSCLICPCWGLITGSVNEQHLGGWWRIRHQLGLSQGEGWGWHSDQHLLIEWSPTREGPGFCPDKIIWLRPSRDHLTSPIYNFLNIF